VGAAPAAPFRFSEHPKELVRYVILKRLGLSLPLVFAVTAITFILISLTPGDAADAIYGAEGNPAAKEAMRAELGLDRPLPAQYGRWVSRAVRGNFGSGINERTPVTHFIKLRVWTSVSLILGALLLSVTVGLSLGMFSAVRGGFLGRAVDILSLLGVALPSFIMGVVLIVVFASMLRWFPATGYVPLTQSPWQWFRSLVLPVVALAMPGIATIARVSRESMLDVLSREHIRTLRLNGFPERSIIFRYALKNAAVPVVTVVGLSFVGLLSGTVLVENVFALGGLGSLVRTATTDHELSVILALVTCFTLVVVVMNLLVDIAYSWLNPKVRTS
jgi:peptide/nickel transport system permease protein